MSDSENDFGGKLIWKILSGLILVPLIMWLFPWVIPFGFWEFWAWKGTPIDWLYSARPLFIWGVVLAAAVSIFTKNSYAHNVDAEEIFTRRTFWGILAGVWEEIAFRWLIFLANIFSMKLGNFFVFGWLGFGVAKWLHLNAVGPLADLATGGYLTGYIYHPASWAVGASMLATNAFFRDGHQYQGWIGWINSWFAGMFLFWMMFKHGLLAAILAHAAYNIIVHLIHYFDAVIERRIDDARAERFARRW